MPGCGQVLSPKQQAKDNTLKEAINLHTMCIACVCYVIEHFYVFSNNIRCLSATFEQKHSKHRE